jgi:hypothetical protein
MLTPAARVAQLFPRHGAVVGVFAVELRQGVPEAQARVSAEAEVRGCEEGVFWVGGCGGVEDEVWGPEV